MTDNEYIKLNRKIVNWEWYMNINVKTLFIHCLLKANWKDGRFEGKEIKRGSFVTSLEKLSKETGLSVRQVRTALDKLFLTGELTSTSFSKYRIVTVVNYNQYQLCDKQTDNQLTSKRQASDKQVTTIEEVKNIRTKELNKELSNDNSISFTDKTHHKKICDKWNELTEYGIQGIRSITPGSKREKSLQARLKEFGQGSFDELVEHFKISSFLQGKATSFKPDFDWAITATYYSKILEGKYDDDRKERKQQSGFDMEEFLRRFDEE